MGHSCNPLGSKPFLHYNQQAGRREEWYKEEINAREPSTHNPEDTLQQDISPQQQPLQINRTEHQGAYFHSWRTRSNVLRLNIEKSSFKEIYQLQQVCQRGGGLRELYPEVKRLEDATFPAFLNPAGQTLAEASSETLHLPWLPCSGIPLQTCPIQHAQPSNSCISHCWQLG